MNDDYLMETATGEQAQLDDVGEDTGTEATTHGVFEEGQSQDAASTSDDEVTELAREREMRVAAEARYKTVQGQYESFERKQNEFNKTRDETAQLRESHTLMQAQLEDMRVLMKAQPAQLEEPVFDETLKGFLGDQSAGFEQALTRAATKAAAAVRAEADQKIAALSAQLAEVQKKNQAVPFDALRNSDSTYDEPGFAEFISAEKDPIFGVSVKEQMAQLHAQGRDVIPALKRARDAYVAKRGGAATVEQPNVTPRLATAGGAASKAQPTKTNIKSLQAEYETLVKSNLSSGRTRRLEIAKLLAQNGIL